MVTDSSFRYLKTVKMLEFIVSKIKPEVLDFVPQSLKVLTMANKLCIGLLRTWICHL